MSAPKPAAIRRREGNPGKRPIYDEARVGSAVARSSDFPAPAHLPESAVAVWNEVVPELAELGLVRSIDASMIEALARAVARAREAEQALDDDGLFMPGSRGGMVAHPAAKIAADQWKLALRIAESYGMTAIGRLRVGAAVLQQKSLADELRDFFDSADDADVIDVEPVAAIEDVLAELDDPPKPARRKPAAKKKPRS